MTDIKLNQFAAFILTYGRPDHVITYKLLKRSGYTGRIFLVVSDDDKSAHKYQSKYKEEVILFNKQEASESFDVGDNFDDMRAVVYARNAIWGIAAQLGVEYFIMLDDDYTQFSFKFNHDRELSSWPIRKLDRVFLDMVWLLNISGAHSVAMAQGGDFLGGKKSDFAANIRLIRKVMNTFVCATNKPFEFMGKINEDVNAYVCHGSRGLLFLTTNIYGIQQTQTQDQEGGLTDIYLDSGTYVKSFYSVMMAPSCARIILMGKMKRLHHEISWNNAVPVIISDKWQKEKNR